MGKLSLPVHAEGHPAHLRHAVPVAVLIPWLSPRGPRGLPDQATRPNLDITFPCSENIRLLILRNIKSITMFTLVMEHPKKVQLSQSYICKGKHRIKISGNFIGLEFGMFLLLVANTEDSKSLSFHWERCQGV